MSNCIHHEDIHYDGQGHEIGVCRICQRVRDYNAGDESRKITRKRASAKGGVRSGVTRRIPLYSEEQRVILPHRNKP